MQEVKFVLRQVGVPNPQLNIISIEELSEYIAFNLTSQGFKLFSTDFLGNVAGDAGAVQGYKYGLWFTKESDEPAVKVKVKS